MAIDQLCAEVLPCSSYLTDHIRSACRSVFAWLAGWADFPRVSSDAMAPDQSPKATLWGPIGEERERGGIGAVRVFACGMAGNASKDDSYPILP